MQTKLLLVLTAPIRASPEPMLMAVGMMLNFPAYEQQQKYNKPGVVVMDRWIDFYDELKPLNLVYKEKDYYS